MPRKYVECLFYLFLMCLMVSLCVFLLTTPLRPPKTEEWSEIRGVVVVGMVGGGGRTRLSLRECGCMYLLCMKSMGDSMGGEKGRGCEYI